jgi:hypothetical protein
VDKRNDNTRAGVTDGVAQGDSAAINVDLGSWNVENLLGDIHNNGEGLVDFEQRDFVNGQASLLEGLGNGKGRGGGEVNGFDTSIGVSW